MDANQRKARIAVLLERLRDDVDIASRDLKAVLSKEQFAALQQQWDEQRELRVQMKEKPPEVAEYEKRLQKALFEYAKGEGYSGSTRRKRPVGSDGKRPGTRAYRRAETGFERLIEYLEERLTADPGLCIWFDRQIDFGPTGDLGLSPEQMPRVVTSRSLDRRGDGWLAGIQSKRDVKRMVLEHALSEIADAEEVTARVAARVAEEIAREELERHEQQLSRMKLLGKRRRP
jgi:hypothetical protein